MQASDVTLPLSIGARSLWTFQRRLIRHRIGLSGALDGALPPMRGLAAGEDGYFLTGLPAARVDAVRRACPNLRPFIRQRYRRSYADLSQSFEDYLARFSAKSRSTLKRKSKRLAELSGGVLDVRRFQAADDMDAFHRDACAVSSLSYQERLLGAGLPAGAEDLRAMKQLASADAVRGWILYLEGRPIAYLYAPAESDVLIYAFLGYDPDYAHLSPGTVLQLEVMRQLCGQVRFRWLDFTEGDGQHKRQFATDGLDCVDLALLRPRLANLMIAGTIGGFDRTVALLKRGLSSLGGGALVRKLRR